MFENLPQSKEQILHQTAGFHHLRISPPSLSSFSVREAEPSTLDSTCQHPTPEGLTNGMSHGLVADFVDLRVHFENEGTQNAIASKPEM